MRSRIEEEMSDFYKNEIMLPGIVAEYEVGFHEMVTLNKAYALMLLKQGILNESEAHAILDGLTRVRQELKVADLDGKYEELYFNVETALFQRVDRAIAGKLHTGRSRNDIYATLWRMEVRRSLLELCELVVEFREELIDKARENLHTVVTGYTHTQPAQPITLGHYYMAVADSLERDFTRLRNSFETTNLCPYGAAALAGTVFPIDRDMLRDLLGFDGLLRNTLDAVQTRDYQLEALSAMAIMAVTLSRVAHDHYIWCTDEFNIFELSGQLSISSSIMPQKKNPGALETAKAKAAHVIGGVVAALSAVKNVPFSLCLDLFEVSAPYWNAYRNVTGGVKLLKNTVKLSRFNKDLALERARRNFSTVTALADHLVKVFDIDFTAAHSIVGTMVARVHESGLLMDGMTNELLQHVSKDVIGTPLELGEKEMEAILDPLGNVKAKETYGGPSAVSVETMIAESGDKLQSEKEWLDARRKQMRDAYAAIAIREKELARRVAG